MPSPSTILKVIFYDFLRGISDSLRGIFKIFHYDNQTRISKSPSERYHGTSTRRRLQKRPSPADRDENIKLLPIVLNCGCLNGIFTFFTVFCFYSLLLPTINFILELILNETLAQSFWANIKPCLVFGFEVFWLIPVFLLSRIINAIWFQDIANNAYRQRQGRPQVFPSFSILVADTLISCVIQLLFLIQATLFHFIPCKSVACFLYIFHMCFLNSLYSFEYRWCNMALPLDRRLREIEKNWLYYLGFGLPLSVLTYIPSSVTWSGCIWATIFPIFIISANEAVTVPLQHGVSFKLFSGVVWISNILANMVFKGSKKGDLRERARSP